MGNITAVSLSDYAFRVLSWACWFYEDAIGWVGRGFGAGEGTLARGGNMCEDGVLVWLGGRGRTVWEQNWGG